MDTSHEVDTASCLIPYETDLIYFATSYIVLKLTGFSRLQTHADGARPSGSDTMSSEIRDRKSVV